MKTAFMVLQICTQLPDLLRMVEKLIPEGGNGAAKLSLVSDLLEAIFGDLSDNWPKIEAIIARFVRFFNEFGW